MYVHVFYVLLRTAPGFRNSSRTGPVGLEPPKQPTGVSTLIRKVGFKIPSDECVGVILDFFFDSTAKTLVIYREFWY